MKWANAFSTRPSLEAAVNEVVETARESLACKPDLGIIFISAAFASEYPRLMPLLAEQLPEPILIGCGGGGAIGSGPVGAEAQEVERSPALSLTLARLPEVEITTFHLLEADLPDLDASPDRWAEAIGVFPEAQPKFILLADPFSSQINNLLQGIDYAYPGSVTIGGLASAGSSNLGMSLFSNNRHYQEGTIGVALSGKIVIETIVAQGCRPIGQPYRIIQGERNVLLQLQPDSERSATTAAQTPLEALQSIIQTLNPEDRQLAQHSLFIGLVRDEFKPDLDRGDFLIRNIIGIDPRLGAIAIGDRVRPGQRIQFHLRDARTSAEDLEMWLQKRQGDAAGALLFSCLGRGEGLYGKPNFESQLFDRYFKDVPLGGFFCNGEIGPVGESTFLHGYTSVFGICHEIGNYA
ncbi:FIST N-terminal domain-containing protein [Oscillatoria sp. FACHB-1406]|uniref:FIST N-terminal domain-containing protein n=1 Tax=Oscillatoria sp. FACHB-1406 TaxID=2692846 RepID=UPI0018F03393